MDNSHLIILRKFINYQRVVICKSEHSLISYETDLKQFLDYLETNEEIVNLNEVNNITIRSFMSFLNKSGINKRSINRKLSAIKSFYRYLLMENSVESDPTLLVTAPKFEKPLPTVLTDSEVKKIIASIDTSDILGIRDRAMIELLYSSGMRAAELLSLSEYSLNFSEREARVTGKGEKERITFFSKTASEWVRKYISAKQQQYKNYSKDKIFVNSKGVPITDRSLRRIVEFYGKKAEINKNVSPHTFRHSFATELMNRGLDIKFLQELLGHSSIATTQVYTTVSKDYLREVYMNTHPFAKE